MTIVVFGTGNYYKFSKEYIKASDILCFIDNSPEKWGTELDGKEIVAPDAVNYELCDYVLIMINNYTEPVEQLLSLNVPSNKIRFFYELNYIYPVSPYVVSGGHPLSLGKWSSKYNNDKILLICHELSRNGISVVLMHLAELMNGMGYHTVVAGLLSGNIIEELAERRIDYLSQIYSIYGSEEFLEFASGMKCIIPGTIGVADVVHKMAGLKVPIRWWMHESDDKYFKDFKLVFKNWIKYYGGGKRVTQCFKMFYPDKTMEEMLYFLPDIIELPHKKHNDFRIAIIGIINKRKGQDVFLDALDLLPRECLENVHIDFIGSYLEPVVDLDEAQSKFGIRYIKELSQEELIEYYTSLDLLVSPSRDDPMPVVVTQAMQNGVPCIVSDQVGQSEFFAGLDYNMIFKSENSSDLASILEFCINNQETTHKIGQQLHSIFERHFSASVMKKNITSIMEAID